MIAVDTYILVRYAVKDDRGQALLATNLLAGNHCFVLKTVLLEFAWVLSSSAGYNLPKEIIHERMLHNQVLFLSHAKAGMVVAAVGYNLLMLYSE